MHLCKLEVAPVYAPAGPHTVAADGALWHKHHRRTRKTRPRNSRLRSTTKLQTSGPRSRRGASRGRFFLRAAWLWSAARSLQACGLLFPRLSSSECGGTRFLCCIQHRTRRTTTTWLAERTERRWAKGAPTAEHVLTYRAVRLSTSAVCGVWAADWLTDEASTFFMLVPCVVVQLLPRRTSHVT